MIKLGDFGISKIIATKGATTVLGTPYYISPEMVRVLGTPYYISPEMVRSTRLLNFVATVQFRFQVDLIVHYHLYHAHYIIYNKAYKVFASLFWSLRALI